MAEWVDKTAVTRCQEVWERFAVLDQVMIAVGKWTPILMLLLIATATANIGVPVSIHPFVRNHAIVAVVSAVFARLANEPVSRWFSRLRPFELYGFTPLLGHEGGYSFPSNHATGAFALSVSMFAVPNYGPVLLILAFLLTISRVYTGLHHVTDVLAGALHGLFFAVAFLTLYSIF